MTSWRKIASKLVYQSPYGSLYEDQIITPDGRHSVYYKDVAHPAVTIVALDSQNNIYLIKEDKYITGGLITLPAGMVEKEENFLQAAKRELKEEMGLKAKRWRSLGFFWGCPGRSDLRAHMFLAQKLIEEKQKLDPGEKIEVLKTPFKKTIQMIKEGQITDAWAIIPIFKTKLLLGI